MNPPKVSVVMTTINSREGTAIPEYEKVCKALGWDLIVIGDKKTPDMELEYGEYFSPKDQINTGFKLAEMLPWNCYGRKNIGYLIAYTRGSDYIISTDDDNYPLSNYHTMLDAFKIDSGDILLGGERQFLNYLEYFNTEKDKVWPRGLPLGSIHNTSITNISRYTKKVGIVAGTWNGSPDFDAIGHMIYDDREWTFGVGMHIFKQSGIAPYNTQNTMISRELLPYQFLPIGINRADDIWASYIAHPILGLLCKGILYISPTVYQKRNPHDYVKDMNDEKRIILQTEELMDELYWTKIDQNPIQYYKNLSKTASKFISPDHVKHIDTWIEELGV